MASFVGQDLTSQIIASGIGYQAQEYYPSYSYAPPVANGYTKSVYTIGVTNGITDQAGADIRATYLNSLGTSNPWVNDPAGAVWDEDCGFWRAWMITTPEYGIPNTSDGQTVWTEVVSSDLLVWTYNQAPFLAQYDTFGQMWGGSVIIDTNNTAGLGAGTVFYFVSSPGPSGAYVTQTISRWCAPALGYPPILEGCILAPPLGYPRQGGSGFRDSRVFWDSDRSEWVIGMTIDYGLCFYTSPDLNNWTFQWVEDLNTWNQIECPNLFRMRAQDGTYKWIMMCSMKGYGPGGADEPGIINGANQAIGYLVGQWDGTKFIRDTEYADLTKMPRLLSQGPDWYAQAPFWKDYSGTECYIWAWIGNWAYSGNLPFQGYMGVQSMVTRMILNDQGDGQGYRLFNQILDGQSALYPKNNMDYNQWIYGNGSDDYLVPTNVWKGGDVSSLPVRAEKLEYTNLEGNDTVLYVLPSAWRLDVSIAPVKQLGDEAAMPLPDEFSITFCSSLDQTIYTRLGFQFSKNQWYFDRKQSGTTLLAQGSGNAGPQAMFDAVSTGTLAGAANDISIICDGGLVEILINGDQYICSVLFPPEKACMAYLSAFGPSTTALMVYRSSIWW